VSSRPAAPSDQDVFLVVTASHDCTAQISRVSPNGAETTCTPLAALHLHDSPVADVASSQDGENILTAGWDGLIGLWSTSIPEMGEVPLETVAAPERKKRRKVQEDGSVKTKAPSAVLRSHTARVSAVRFSPGGGAVSCGFDSTVRTWDVERGLCAHTIVGTHCSLCSRMMDRANTRARYHRRHQKNHFSPSHFRQLQRLLLPPQPIEA
jgi:ribosome biogenesis protein